MTLGSEVSRGMVVDCVVDLGRDVVVHKDRYVAKNQDD